MEEEERETQRRLCEALFTEERRLVRTEDIPFHGWTTGDIVLTLLQDVRNQVGSSSVLMSKNIQKCF